jgi:hypothetical protein
MEAREVGVRRRDQGHELFEQLDPGHDERSAAQSRRYVDGTDVDCRFAPPPPRKAVCVGYPVTFDFMFVQWYLHRFADGSPWSHSALDMKTFAWVLLGGHFTQATKRHMPRAWFGEARGHTHVAVDDAREQGQLFFGMWRAHQGAMSKAP